MPTLPPTPMAVFRAVALYVLVLFTTFYAGRIFFFLLPLRPTF